MTTPTILYTDCEKQYLWRISERVEKVSEDIDDISSPILWYLSPLLTHHNRMRSYPKQFSLLCVHRLHSFSPPKTPVSLSERYTQEKWCIRLCQYQDRFNSIFSRPWNVTLPTSLCFYQHLTFCYQYPHTLLTISHENCFCFYQLLVGVFLSVFCMQVSDLIGRFGQHLLCDTYPYG